MTTPFGKAVRKMRIDKDVLLKDMADDLGVKSAYLSAVEMGKKRITENLLGQVVAYFGGAPEVAQRLGSLVEQSQPDFKVELRHPTQDPKYDIEDGRLVNSSTGVPIPHDEPIFIFRAKDRHLLPVLAEYRMRCKKPSHIQAVELREEEIWQWQNRNIAKLKEPDTDSAAGDSGLGGG